MGAEAAEFHRTPTFARIGDYPFHFASLTPAADAVVDAVGSMSYREFVASIDLVAHALLAAGVRRGDRVAVLAPPSRDHLVSFMAAARIGAVWMGLNPRHTREELAVVLSSAAPAAVLSFAAIDGREFGPDLVWLRLHVLGDTSVVATFDEPVDGCTPWAEFVAAGQMVAAGELAEVVRAVTADDPVLLVYTSGTSGTPKGALLTHRAVVTTARVQCERWWAEPFRILNNVPINHIGGAVQIACHALVAGGTNVLMPRFEPAMIPAVVSDCNVTVLHQVPTMYRLLLDTGTAAPAQFAGLQVLVWSGAAASIGLVGELRALCPNLFTSFGQTETGGEVLYTPAGATDADLATSVGVADPRIEVRLSDGSVGELQVRGPTVMLGYLGQPDATVTAFTADGWLRTGDLAERTADGAYRIVGRLKDMYKSGGYNVYPREVEAVLEAHADVAMAAVVATPDDVFGEVGVAWVLSEVSPDVEELDRHCRAHLANYKVPKRFHVRSELPMLPIGKIDKAALRGLL